MIFLQFSFLVVSLFQRPDVFWFFARPCLYLQRKICVHERMHLFWAKSILHRPLPLPSWRLMPQWKCLSLLSTENSDACLKQTLDQVSMKQKTSMGSRGNWTTMTCRSLFPFYVFFWNLPSLRTMISLTFSMTCSFVPSVYYCRCFKQTNKIKNKNKNQTCQWTLTLTWLVGFQTNKRPLFNLPNTWDINSNLMAYVFATYHL
jgi:hypothetical protein